MIDDIMLFAERYLFIQWRVFHRILHVHSSECSKLRSHTLVQTIEDWTPQTLQKKYHNGLVAMPEMSA